MRRILLVLLPFLFVGCSTICDLVPSLPGCPDPTPTPACIQPCAGDCNGDCVVTDGEVECCGEVFAGRETCDKCPCCDGDGDGTVSAAELQAALANSQVAGGSCPK